MRAARDRYGIHEKRVSGVESRRRLGVGTEPLLRVEGYRTEGLAMSPTIEDDDSRFRIREGVDEVLADELLSLACVFGVMINVRRPWIVTRCVSGRDEHERLTRHSTQLEFQAHDRGWHGIAGDPEHAVTRLNARLEDADEFTKGA